MRLKARVYSKVGRKIPNLDIEVRSLREASKKYIDFTESNNLECSQCSEGILSNHGVILARVSYNGRVWGMASYVEDGSFMEWIPSHGPLYDPYETEGDNCETIDKENTESI